MCDVQHTRSKIEQGPKYPPLAPALQPLPTTRKRRCGYVPSHNGCLTCRTRRVKCDEVQPVCGPCSKGLRQCRPPRVFRYQFKPPETPTSFSSRPQTRPTTHPQLLRGSHEERRAFDYFVHVVGPILAGIHDLEFWQKVVPRWSVSDSVVWLAIVSISRLYEQVKTATLDSFEQARFLPGCQWALDYHGRAIKAYRQRLQSPNHDIPTALLSCILFALFEFELWNVDTALVLVQSCFKMMALMKRCPSDLDVNGKICNFFARLSNLLSPSMTTSLITHKSPCARQMFRLSVLFIMPDRLDEYRIRLYGLMHEATLVTRQADPKWISAEAVSADELFMRQTRILQSLEDWRQEILKFRTERPCDSHTWLLSLLMMYYWTTYIHLSVCMSQQETKFDKHVNGFGEILHHAKIGLTFATSAKMRSPFSVELCPVRPLFFTAFKCRHRRIRRQAVETLRQSKAVTSIGKHPGVVNLASAIIATEEDGMDSNLDLQDSKEVRTVMASEDKRVRQVDVSKPLEDEGGVVSEQATVAKLLIHPCASRLQTHDCAKTVSVDMHTGEILSDVTIHASGCSMG
ncbi:hypothetical protein LTS07_006542 [Exophiala sideris]|nr:hypothetical protein LTS07_006542 [Exophiala sideris]